MDNKINGHLLQIKNKREAQLKRKPQSTITAEIKHAVLLLPIILCLSDLLSFSLYLLLVYYQSIHVNDLNELLHERGTIKIFINNNNKPMKTN